MQFCILFIKMHKTTIHLYLSLYFFWHKTCECVDGEKLHWNSKGSYLFCSAAVSPLQRASVMSCHSSGFELVRVCACVHVRVFIYERAFPVCMMCVSCLFSFSSYVLHIMSDAGICYVSKDFLSWHQMFGIIDQRDSERLGRCAQRVRVWDKSGSERESQLCCLPTEPRSPHPDSWKINKEGKANEKKQKGPFVAPGEVSFKRRSHSTEPWSKAWLR